jgi:hypothetical protein
MGPAIVPLPNDIGNAAAGPGDGTGGLNLGGWDRGATHSVMAVLGAAIHDFAGTGETVEPAQPRSRRRRRRPCNGHIYGAHGATRASTLLQESLPGTGHPS